MQRKIGTVVTGIRGPIINQGDDIATIAVESVLGAVKAHNIELNDKDVVAITESVVARAQGNYVSTDDIAADVKAKMQSETIGIVFPILSRNRFSICLKGMAKAAQHVVLQLSLPSDEVGNHLIDEDDLEEKDINPLKDCLEEPQYRELFGYPKHPFTGMDYVAYYREVIESTGAKCTIIFSNRATSILKYTEHVIACDIHTRNRTKRHLEKGGAKVVLTMADIVNQKTDKHGYNEDYGLYGSNKATEDKVKLFPTNCQPIVERVQARIKEETGKTIEIMIYGDGAFKDPVGKIWELADPVVSPAYTSGLEGTPNELKLKYLADNDFAGMDSESQAKAIEQYIKEKSSDLKGNMQSQGTTPRQLTDLLGSLCDLTSGSGDKGTPFILIQGYFDNYAD